MSARGSGPEWLEAHLEWFDPRVWNALLPARPFPAGPLLELLLLCERVPGLRVTGPALELADRLTAAPEFRAGLYRADAHFTYHVWLLVLMQRLGAPRPRLLSAAQALLDSGVRPNLDGVAALELKYVTDLGGLANHGLPPTRRLYDRWRAGQHLDPFRLTANECYALTHAVFYATAFGEVSVPADPDLARAARLLLAAYLADDDLDLGAELFHTALLVGGPQGLGAARNRLAEAAQPDGAVAGPVHDPAVQARLTGRKAEAYRFGTCYHTTIVTELALAASWPRPAESGRPVPEPAEELVIAWRRNDLGRTAKLVQAAAGETRLDPIITAAVRRLQAQRQPDGNFGIPVDAGLTALCIAALEAWEAPELAGVASGDVDSPAPAGTEPN
ncbi:hypothetical protein [Amycolatopsis sp. NPDC004169]|uniref:DUF6895 family protein n=1 Tax=Amycolatopsis sp. NPDC004169 TaxID=3154453 RepID=UPI0033AB5289